jgi:hypothetical protein
VQKTIPDHSPLVLRNAVCSGCGDEIKPEIVKNSRGNVEHLKYIHRNPTKGCSYYFITNEYMNVEMKAMRVDGTEAKL